MKRHLKLLIIVLLCSACRHHHATGKIELSRNEIAFSHDGGEADVELYTTSLWRVEAKASWLSLYTVSYGKYRLCAPANDSTARSGHILFISGTDSARLDVAQSPSKEFSLSATEISLSHRGDAEEITVKCYDQWAIKDKSTHIHTDITEGTSPSPVTITADPNTKTSDIPGFITFVSDGKEITADITQLAKPFVTLDKETLHIDGDGGDIKSLFLTNYNVKVINDSPWIRTVHHDSVSNILYLEILRNMEYREREDTITLKCTVDTSIFADLRIIQGEKINHPALEFEEGYNMGISSRESFTLHPIFIDMYDSTLVWSSSATEIASVDQNGKVDIYDTGTTRITIKNQYHNVSAEITLDIKLMANSMTVMLGDQDMNSNPVAIRFVGESQKMEFILHPDNSYNEDIVCFSSEPNIVSVSGSTLNYIAPGTATIYVESQYHQIRQNFRIIVSEL